MPTPGNLLPGFKRHLWQTFSLQNCLLPLVMLFLSNPSYFLKCAEGCTTVHTVVNNTVFIGGIFPFTRMDMSTFQWVRNVQGSHAAMGFKLAVDHINSKMAPLAMTMTERGPSPLLPDYTIEYAIFDTKNDAGFATLYTHTLLTQFDPLTLFGGGFSEVNLVMQYQAELCGTPQMGYMERANLVIPAHPTQMRTSLSDIHTTVGILAYLRSQGWNRISVVNMNDLTGAGYQALLQILMVDYMPELLVKAFVKFDIADLDGMEESRQQGVELVRTSTANIVWLTVNEPAEAVYILSYYYQAGLVGSRSNYLWIVTTMTGEDLYRRGFLPLSPLPIEAVLDILTGTQQLVPGFRGNMHPANGADLYNDVFMPGWSQRPPTGNSSSGWCDSGTDSIGQPIWTRLVDENNPTTGYCAGLDSEDLPDSTAVYAYDAVLAFAQALHVVLYDKGLTTFTNADLMDAYVRIQMVGASGFLHFQNETHDKARMLGVQLEVQSFNGDPNLGYQYVGTWTPSVPGAAMPAWEPMSGYMPCNSQLSPDCVTPVWPTEDGSFLRGELTCPAGTFIVPQFDRCIPCDVQGMNFYQDETTQLSCKACPLNTERRPESDGSSRLQCLCLYDFYQPDELPGGEECLPCDGGAHCDGYLEAQGVNARPYPLKGYWADPDHPLEFLGCAETYCDGGPNFTCGVDHQLDMDTNKLCVAVAKGSVNIGGYYIACPGEFNSAISWVFSLIVISAVVALFFLVNNFLCNYIAIDVFFKNVRLLAIGSSFGLSWHRYLQPIFAFFRLALFDVDLAQPNCIMTWSFREQFYIQLVLPGFMSSLYFLPYLYKLAARRFDIGKMVKVPHLTPTEEVISKTLNEAIGSSVGILMTCYPSFITVVLAALRCNPFHGTGDTPHGAKLYLTIDPNMACFEEGHTIMYVIAILCVPVAALSPLGVGYVVIYGLENKRLHLESWLERFGGLYQQYETHYLFWESLFMLKVFLLVVIQVFIVDYPLAQVFISMGIHLTALSAHFFARPYLHKHVNLLESAMLTIVCIFTMGGTLFYDEAELTSEQTTMLSVCIILMMSIIAIYAPMAAWIDVAHDQASTKARKYVNKTLLALIPTLETGTRCHSLRLKEAIDYQQAKIANRDSGNRDSDSMKPSGSFAGLLSSTQSLDKVALKWTEKKNEKDRVKKLELEEINKTVRGRYFLKFCQEGGLTLRDFDKLLTLDELIAPFVCDLSETSVYSRNGTAEYWRKLTGEFPGLLDAVSKCTTVEVEEMRRTFEKLHTLAASYVDRSPDSGLHFIDLVAETDRSSICYWLANTEHEHRNMFFGVLESIALANGMKPFKRKVQQKIDRKSSAGRLVEQWKGNARILQANVTRGASLKTLLQKKDSGKGPKQSFLSVLMQAQEVEEVDEEEEKNVNGASGNGNDVVLHPVDTATSGTRLPNTKQDLSATEISAEDSFVDNQTS